MNIPFDPLLFLHCFHGTGYAPASTAGSLAEDFRGQVLFCHICLTTRASVHFNALALAVASDLDLHFPCEAVIRGRQARRGVDTMSTPFRQHMATAWMPELRQRRSGCPSPASAEEGGLSFLRASCPSPFRPASLFALLLQRSGDFLLAVQEKATRAPKAHESLCFKVALKWDGWLSRSGCFRPEAAAQKCTLTRVFDGPKPVIPSADWKRSV